MAYQVNWTTQVISIPASDLVWIDGKHYSLDINTFRKEVRRLEWEFVEGLSYISILEHTDPKTISGTTYFPFDEVINGYTVTFIGDVERVDLLNSNNNIVDVLNYSGVSVVPSNTAGGSVVTVDSGGGGDTDVSYIPKAIWVDTGAATNGDGSQGSPFDNVTDGKDYSEATGIKNIFLSGSVTVPGNLKGVKIYGIGIPDIDFNGQDIKDSEFYHCKLSGTYTNEIIADECHIENGMLLNGHFSTCELLGNHIVASSAHIFMMNCTSKNTTISMNSGVASDVSIYKHNGKLTISDSDHADDIIDVHISEGNLTFDSSCIAGVMTARGGCKFTNAANGAIVVNETYTQADVSLIPSFVWSYGVRELSLNPGMTPAQEAKLDDLAIDIDGIPAAVLDEVAP